jgi:hypothetical protein
MPAFRISVIWLAACLFALRAFMPAGFMPDPDALREGHFRIIYCGGAAPMPPAMDMASHVMQERQLAMQDGRGLDAMAGDLARQQMAADSGRQGMASDHDLHGMSDGRVRPAMSGGQVHAAMSGGEVHPAMSGGEVHPAMSGDQVHHAMADGRSSMDGGDSQAPRTPGHSGMADCPFGLSSAYTHVLTMLAAWAPLLAVAWHVPAAVPPAAPSSGVVAGPPVGSRAPPHRLD